MVKMITMKVMIFSFVACLNEEKILVNVIYGQNHWLN